MGFFSRSSHHLPIACFISFLFEKSFIVFPRMSQNLPAEILLSWQNFIISLSVPTSICFKVLHAYFLFPCLMMLFFPALCLSLHIGLLPVVIFGGILEKVIFLCLVFFISHHTTYSYFSRFLYGLYLNQVLFWQVLCYHMKKSYRNNAFW